MDIPNEIMEKARADYEYECNYNRAKEIVKSERENKEKESLKQYNLRLINDPEFKKQEYEIKRLNRIENAKSRIEDLQIKIQLTDHQTEKDIYQSEIVNYEVDIFGNEHPELPYPKYVKVFKELKGAEYCKHLLY